MPELRKDPILDRWVIISTDRQKRPTDFFLPEVSHREGGFCPFCEGNEDKTPFEIYARGKEDRKVNEPGWSLRVVPNRFPALTIEGDLKKEGEGLYDKITGVGAHEVIIETPDHTETLASMSVEKFIEVLEAYRARITDLKRDKRFKYVLVFKNHGMAAGASLEHSHSQLIALPIIPKRVGEELAGSKRHFNYKERCIYCDIIHQEISQKSRIVLENAHFIVLSPFAPKSPFETWILPKKHLASYENIPSECMESLARIFSETLKRLDKALGSHPYNFILHTSPFGLENIEYYHWHFEIMPKLTKTAGFEWGSGFYINPTSPEEAAGFLREAKI
ncbi:MAG: galactose-1-phosphate uridylyltransferase [Deltaproteobacteria bacterium]|nr:galactose-1-phosphate uridylyltransferase [Deltaproteobacteria bacterium]